MILTIAEPPDHTTDDAVRSAADALALSCDEVNDKVGCASGQPGFGTRDCTFEFAEIEDRALTHSDLVACLEARKAHLDCALALECTDLLAWWNKDALYFGEQEREAEFLVCPWIDYS